MAVQLVQISAVSCPSRKADITGGGSRTIWPILDLLTLQSRPRLIQALLKIQPFTLTEKLGDHPHDRLRLVVRSTWWKTCDCEDLDVRWGNPNISLLDSRDIGVAAARRGKEPGGLPVRTKTYDDGSTIVSKPDNAVRIYPTPMWIDYKLLEIRVHTDFGGRQIAR